MLDWIRVGSRVKYKHDGKTSVVINIRPDCSARTPACVEHACPGHLTIKGYSFEQCCLSYGADEENFTADDTMSKRVERMVTC